MDFYISTVLLGFLYHSEEFMVLPGHCICCFLQPCKIMLLGCRGFFCPEVLCSMVVYLLDRKKCSLQPLWYLSTKSVFIRTESMAELQVSLCISQPTEQKGSWCPSMAGWLTGMLLPPVLPSDLAVLVPGNQNPPHPGFCQAALPRVPGNAVLETRHHRFAFLQGKPLSLWSPFPSFFLHSVTFRDKLAPELPLIPCCCFKHSMWVNPERDRSSSSSLGAALIQEPWSVLCLSCTASSCALCLFAFLCTRKTLLPICRRQNSCVLSDNVSSTAFGLRAVVFFWKWSSQFALSPFLSCFVDSLLLLG